MKKLTPLKNHKQESRLFAARALTAYVVIMLVFLALMGRLVYLQLVQHDKYQTLAENNRVKLVPIAPNRGLIYDRQGVLLAENLPAYSLQIIPEKITNIKATLAALKKIIAITPTEEAEFYATLKTKHHFQGITVRLQLTEVELANFLVQKHRFPGVEINAHLVRHYLYPELTAHSVGYVGRINQQEMDETHKSNYSATQHIGKTGVEKQYEDILHGTVGYQQVELNATGRIVRVLEYHPPQAGKDLYLSLDIKLQQVAQAAIGDKKASLVAIEPASGEILALVSTPAFDTNLFVQGIDHATYQALRDNPDRPLFNRALSAQYPPASTIKPILGIYGLENQYIAPQTTIYDPGYFQLPNHEHRYRDWYSHGYVNLHKAIAESCDTFFYKLAVQMGIDQVAHALQLFGYGARTGIDLPGESSGLVPTPAWKKRTQNRPWYPGETVIVSIGQGHMLATPLQLAHATATLANQGKRMQPHIVKSIKTPTEASLDVTPIVITQIPVHDPDNWQAVRQGMVAAVHSARGTARDIGQNSAYLIAGKTGTAQLFNLKGTAYKENKLAKHLRDHRAFIAYAPADDPQIAVAVFIENETGQMQIARLVMDYYLQGKEPAENSGNPL